jgi:hypothetical protein
MTRLALLPGALILMCALATAADESGELPQSPKLAHHTQKPPVDVAKALPDLAKLARTAVRLHPRQGTCGDEESKLGGKIAWPKGEAWPTCRKHGCAYVAVLQLRSEGVRPASAGRWARRGEQRCGRPPAWGERPALPADEPASRAMAEFSG